MLTEPDGGQRVNLLEKFIDSLPESNIYKYFSEPTAELEVEKTADSNAVQVVTIHKSKGLEYPVVFLANTSRKFNMKSFYSDTIISKQLGLGINYFDQEGRIKKASLAKEAIKLTETRKSIEEQQRLLYVALTRAINKLYVVASKDFSKIKGYFPERQSSFSDWFNEFVQKDLSCEADYDFLIKTFDAEVLIGAATKPPKEQILFSDKPSALSSLMQDVASKKYLYEEATKMPQKTSVTEIASGYHESEEVYQRYNKKSSERSTSSTDKGNAYHKLMQYIDFDCKNAQDLDACINRLICQGKLTETDEKYIDKKQILALLNNSAFNQILASGQILREKEFFMNIGQNDIQIVQGVIDLMVLGNDGAVVLDYKTGNFDRPESLVKYRAQLNLYAEAVQKCYGTKVKSKGIVAIEQSKILFLD
jgi:ATP-dependent helicase/nuclease subunit A